MARSKRLAWDEYWRLVMRLYSDKGITKSFPETEMRRYYDEGISPLEAMESAVRKYGADSEGAKG